MSRSAYALVVATLIFITVIVFIPVRNHDFLVYDDNRYVTENRAVLSGLTWEGVRWAFSTGYAGNWHPLTWMSHMIDIDLFGTDAGGHHAVNLLLHIINTLLLFAVLRSMTGALWRSAAVAALFAVHPLHVESVAWVAERKDVLSTFFWLLTMASYLRYVRRPGTGRYLPVAGAFSLGLMAKPMLVSLPFILLLLDYWPLGRWDTVGGRGADPQSVSFPRWKSLVREKIPLFLIAAISAAVTFLVQYEGGAVKSMQQFPLDIRLQNAVVSYVKYLGKTLCPQGLAVYYPHPGDSLSLWQVALAGAFIGLITFGALRILRRAPYLGVGWFWYLVTLVPVIGLVQVGTQAMADRYTYVPLTGIFLALVWALYDLARPRPNGRIVLAGACLLVIPLLAVTSRQQLGHWENSTSLFQRALDVTPDDVYAHNFLGIALEKNGKQDQAIAHFEKAMRINPSDPVAYHNLANVMQEQGRTGDAIEYHLKVLEIDPGQVQTHYNLGNALMELGRIDDAVRSYRSALERKPDYVDAHFNLALVLENRGQRAEAIEHYERILRVEPFDAGARFNLGRVLEGEGRLDEAMEHYRRVLQIEPEHEKARKALEEISARRQGREQGTGGEQ